MKKITAATALLACAAALAACGTTVSGSATDSAGNTVSVTPTGAPSSAVVPAGLNVGNYPTTTQQMTSPSTDAAWLIEGNRMGDALIQVNEIDPRLRYGGAALRSFPVLSGQQLASRVPDSTAEIFNANKMRVGMTTTRGDKRENPTVAVRIGLYRFDTPEAATKAFEAVKASTRSLRPINITKTQGVSAAEFKPGTVDSYRTEGPFVINISGTGPTTDEGAAFVEKAYELELPKVTSFKPTPNDSVRALPADKDGILSRTLFDPTVTLGTNLNNSYFDLAGLLHRLSDIDAADEYEKAGVDLVSQGLTAVYRTRDAQAASTLAEKFAADDRATSGNREAESPTALPQARCTERPSQDSVTCVVAVGRWMASTGDADIQEAHDKISAQYAILAKNP